MMKGRTSWIQMFTGDDGKDRLVMTYNRYGAGAPNWNNLRVNGYDYNGIFVAGVLVDRFWRDANGDLIISQPRCIGGGLTKISSSYTMETSGWTRLVKESHPGDGTYGPGDYEGYSTGGTVSTLEPSDVRAIGVLYKNFGNVGNFSVNVGLQGMGHTKSVNVYGFVREYDDAQIALRVNVNVDESGFLVDFEVLDSWEDVNVTRTHGSFESSDHWADFEHVEATQSSGRELIEVRKVTVEDDGK